MRDHELIGISLHAAVFHAKDSLHTRVYWDSIKFRWIVENDNGVMAELRHLCGALTCMHQATARFLGDEEYRLRVPNRWVVTNG